jgi:hypothetical protein
VGIIHVRRYKFDRHLCGKEIRTAEDSSGHDAELHERLLPGVALEIRKAAGGEHPLRVLMRVLRGKMLISEATGSSGPVVGLYERPLSGIVLKDL